jgi:hypothetical protein
MSEMIDRAAAALYHLSPIMAPNPCWSEGADNETRMVPLCWETELPEVDKAPFRVGARAAIEALKVPTVEMVVAATEEWLCIRAQEDRAEVIWDAMLDAALTPHPPAIGQIDERERSQSPRAVRPGERARGSG